VQEKVTPYTLSWLRQTMSDFKRILSGPTVQCCFESETH